MDVSPKFIEAGKRNFAIANEKKKALAEERRAAKRALIEERKRQILLKKLHVLLKRRLRAQTAAAMANQHGQSSGDYGRCKKNNGTACPTCRAYIAEYVRVKWHTDPKYKAREKEYLRQNPHKRHINKNRHRLKGGKRKAYTRNQIIKRDGTDCYLCNKPVDFTANHIQGQPGWELYPHIDHVIPLALGGDDTLENVKLAHAICNINKGARLLPA
jgi:5-methylcytosine-specific restriction endonuclease McrA